MRFGGFYLKEKCRSMHGHLAELPHSTRPPAMVNLRLHSCCCRSLLSSYLSVYLCIYAHPQAHISAHAQSVNWTHQKYNATLKNDF